jgi:hypothetical protein
LLKAAALQAMERWAEAVAVLEQCIASGPGRSAREVHEKFAEAQFLVRKEKRPDLYALVGITGVGCKASEKEIRAAYKQRALECHPDRHRDAGEAERKAAEARFKELGGALDVLTDEFKRTLWDAGHDVDSIQQQVRMREQQEEERRKQQQQQQQQAYGRR